MKTPTEILFRFHLKHPKFSSKGITVENLFNEGYGQPGYINALCNEFVKQGLLIDTGIRGNVPMIHKSYVCPKFVNLLADYGYYDFIINGFTSIRNKFYQSVKPVVATKTDDTFTIGTCFIIPEYVVSAMHCIKGMKSIQILNEKKSPLEIETIYSFKNTNIDLVLIKYGKKQFDNTPSFLLNKSEVLDEVLALGYPPIAGFDAIQVSELSHISATLKSSKGKIVGADESYIDQQEYLLINARVKGGNSGGPIINKHGFACGMLIQMASDIENPDILDELGYGIGLPSQKIQDLLVSISDNDKTIIEHKFSITDKGFKLL